MNATSFSLLQLIVMANLIGCAWFLAGQLEERGSPRWANAVLRVIVVAVVAVGVTFGLFFPFIELVWRIRDRHRVRRKVRGRA